MDPITLGGIGMGISALGSIFGASAQQNIAESQLGMARENRSLAMKYAQPTTEELMMQSQQLDNYMRMNSFQQNQLAQISQQLAAMNPQIGEVSKQLYASLRGEKSAWMAPIEQQRAHDRSLLAAQIGERMGGGAMQSTAASQALSNYDYQTGQLLAQAQLQGISALSGIQSNTIAGQGALTGQAFAGAQGVSGLGSNYLAGQSSLAGRMINAINSNPVTPYMGAGSYGQAMMGSALGQMGSTAAGFGFAKGLIG